ncbi:superoxide dismutase [Draconibacterium orientale]|uniref:superoxide dismutase n=1 Tax=Draconibacterium orientale TaxID=1168034 RepID=UPI002ABDEDD3|nr:superoxide dismutase [Draconibacterium orientale]
MERRKFIYAVGTAAMATPLLSSLIACGNETQNFEGHTFPELAYAYDALEPYIDAETMELHYSKHHKGYFTKFMAAAEGTDLLNTPMENIFAGISKQPEGVRNNGGGYYNHALFWENMTPQQGEIPADLKAAIEKDFGSIDAFKTEFATAAKTRFGSGWAWLLVDENGALKVSSTPNQDNPLMDVTEVKGTPLLALDVWEHAYYLNYQNKRGDYINNFWNVVNWDVVNHRYTKATV